MLFFFHALKKKNGGFREGFFSEKKSPFKWNIQFDFFPLIPSILCVFFYCGLYSALNEFSI